MRYITIGSDLNLIKDKKIAIVGYGSQACSCNEFWDTGIENVILL